MNTYTVLELNNTIKDIILNDFNEPVKVMGEISNVKISNNNLFATLKDDDSAINLLSWGFGKSGIIIKNGDKVIIDGKVTFYTKSGTYSLTATKIQHVGIGDLHKLYESIKAECEKNGYFSSVSKKKPPICINRVGIVTATEGAALQDILYVLRKNNFYGKIIVRGCVVQGQTCPQSITDGINDLIKWRDVDNNKLDVILITRGGGSFEDLMGFSDIRVIEAIYKSDIFTISAIGHEIDFMLSDYVADIRTPTPSIAAEYISVNQKAIITKLELNKTYFENYVKSIIEHKLNQYLTKLDSLNFRLKDPTTEIDINIKGLEDNKRCILDVAQKIVAKYLDQIRNMETKVDAYNINKMLETGYALVHGRGHIYDSVENLKVNQKLKLKFKDGEVSIIITSIK